MEPRADATVYEIAYAEAVRALSEQHGVIDSFRTRAGLLLSATAVTTSFLAAQALRDGETSALAWLALLIFAAVAGLSVAMLWPRHWDTVSLPQEVIDATTSLASKRRQARSTGI